MKESGTGDVKPSNIRHLVVVIAVLMLIIIVVFLNWTNSFLPPFTYIATSINKVTKGRNSPTARITSNAIGVVLLNESTVGLLSPSGSLLGTSEPINFSENNSDIFFTVKSTAKNHGPRLSLLLVTWLQTVDPSQLHIVTDSDSDLWIQAIQSRGISITVARQCDTGHTNLGLCCKSGEEFRAYYKATKSTQHKYRWFCHVDDDAYVNMVQLVRLFEPYDPTTQKLFFGHYPESNWHNNTRFQTSSRELIVDEVRNFPTWKSNTFKYAHGSTYCISSSLMNELEMYLNGEKFLSTYKKLHFSDDLTVGVVIEAVLGYNLTEVTAMKSHVVNQKQINPENLTRMVTIGYDISDKNTVPVPDSPFSKEEDPTSYLSYHCLLYSTTSWCLAKTIS